MGLFGASYGEVFSGDVDCKNLEEVFGKFNTDGHPLHWGHSLSVSDVVLTDGGAFFCDTVGFREIEFDEGNAHKPDDILQIVYMEPNRPPFVSEVNNEGSKLIGMEGNRRRIWAFPCIFSKPSLR